MISQHTDPERTLADASPMTRLPRQTTQVQALRRASTLALDVLTIEKDLGFVLARLVQV